MLHAAYTTGSQILVGVLRSWIVGPTWEGEQPEPQLSPWFPLIGSNALTSTWGSMLGALPKGKRYWLLALPAVQTSFLCYLDKPGSYAGLVCSAICMHLAPIIKTNNDFLCVVSFLYFLYDCINTHLSSPWIKGKVHQHNLHPLLVVQQLAIGAAHVLLMQDNLEVVIIDLIWMET